MRQGRMRRICTAGRDINKSKFISRIVLSRPFVRHPKGVFLTSSDTPISAVPQQNTPKAGRVLFFMKLYHMTCSIFIFVEAQLHASDTSHLVI